MLTFYPRKEKQRHLKFSETHTFNQNYLASRNTADVTVYKSIAVDRSLSQV
jgi:hypothetical protein